MVAENESPVASIPALSKFFLCSLSGTYREEVQRDSSMATKSCTEEVGCKQGVHSQEYLGVRERGWGEGWEEKDRLCRLGRLNRATSGQFQDKEYSFLSERMSEPMNKTNEQIKQ